MSADLVARMLSRKFILSLLVQVSATVLLAMGKIDGAQWSQLSMVNLGGFTLGNACEHFARSS